MDRPNSYPPIEPGPRPLSRKSVGIRVCTGAEEQSYMVHNLIPHNTPLPAKVQRVFGTVCDDQREIEITFMENLSTSEVVDIEDCTELGTAVLQLPPGLPAETPITITCRLNDQGRLEVSATAPSGETVSVFLTADPAAGTSEEDTEDSPDESDGRRGEQAEATTAPSRDDGQRRSSPVVGYGIHLGATCASIARSDENGEAAIVPNSEREGTTPSAVYFDGEYVIVGSVAQQCAKLFPDDVVELVTRDLGNPDWTFHHGGESYRPEEIASFILRKVVKDAEMESGETICDVVLTAPAYFGVTQREALAKAAELAGLNVCSIIAEPIAAAIAYGVDNQEDQVVPVYDLGGASFDVALIDVKDGSINLVCINGDRHLGGKEWDAAIVNYLVEQYQQAFGQDEDILEHPETLQDLYISAERAKRLLSQRARVPLAVTHAGNRVKVELTREKLDELTAPLLERTIALTRELLEQARSKGYERFDRILLVGGAARMPQVAERLGREFGVECDCRDPDEVVAKGAALYAWVLAQPRRIDDSDRGSP